MTVPINISDIARLDDWLDANVSEIYQAQPLAQDWARISKIGEELGEVVDAFIGATGQNPRKGTYGDMDAVANELVDVALTALLALQHFTKDTVATKQIINRRMVYRLEKAQTV